MRKQMTPKQRKIYNQWRKDKIQKEAERVKNIKITPLPEKRYSVKVETVNLRGGWSGGIAREFIVDEDRNRHKRWCHRGKGYSILEYRYKFYNTKEFAEIIGRTPDTLRRWDKKGLFKPAGYDFEGRRLYSHKQIEQFVDKNQDKILNKKIIGYCRVSTYSSKEEMEKQMEIIYDYMIKKAYFNHEIIVDIGGGFGFNSQLESLMDMVMRSEVNRIVILSKDRVSKCGFDLIEKVCKKFRTKFEIIEPDLYDQDELVEDIIKVICEYNTKLDRHDLVTTREMLEKLLPVKVKQP